MYKHRPLVYEKVSYEVHPEYEIKATRPSDYLRKYGTGRIEDLPSCGLPEVTDNRTVEQMLDEPVESMATETVDVLMQIEANREKFENAIKDIELTTAKKKEFDDAVAVLNDPNSTTERRREAYSILEELYNDGVVTRTRAKS